MSMKSLEGEKLEPFLLDMGYTRVRDTQHGIIGLYPQIYTHSIVVGIDECGYNHRYCFNDLLLAYEALREWADNKYEDEPDNYIVRKGRGVDKHGTGEM